MTVGQGDVGQLGLGDEILERKRPALLKDVEDVEFKQVLCGGMHTVAVTDGGEVSIIYILLINIYHICLSKEYSIVHQIWTFL